MPATANALAVAVSGLVLFSASACAGTDGQAAGPVPSREGAPSVGAVPVGGMPIPTVGAASADQAPLAWQLIRVDEEHDRVFLDIASKNCSSPQAVVVKEDTRTITITALGAKPPAQACAADRKDLVGYVEPREPIGGRKILHGSQ